jgi:nitric oxide reductase subunit B
MGLDFLAVQEEIQMHFFGLILAASLFSVGIAAFIVNFFKHGTPNDEAMESSPAT